MSTPQVPPRPGRSSQPVANEATKNIPSIPPRPARRIERSVSPARAEYSRSPLNEPPASNGDRIYGHYGHNLSHDDLPAYPVRPSSAFHPSTVGEEGVEYGGFDSQAEQSDASTSPRQTRKVASDLPMHAPKASVPLSTANARIQTVTRTDSSTAAAAGIGKAESETHPLKAKASFSRSNLSIDRPGSSHGTDDEEHGPPSMGLTVPMLKYAGDAQAPSPAPNSHELAGGFAAGRNHHRKHSSRHEFGPPGSYGLHGHGLNSFHGIAEPMDKFDKDWYMKHPEEYLREKGRKYDPGHPSHDWALSSEDLNKLVHQSSSRGLGMGTSPEAVGTPSEQIGYLASEEYTSRMNSPRPLSAVGKRRPSSGNQPPIASPLRKASVPADFEHGGLRQLYDDHAVESEAEDVIHVDAPARRASKVGGGGYDPPTEDFGPKGGNTEEEGGWVVEDGYGMPILASDEVAKSDPAAEYLQPAVSPEQERRGSDYYAGWDSEHPGSYQTGRRSSRDRSRPHSSHGEPLARIRTRDSVHNISGVGTPLEEIEEYEPLFPDDDKEPPKPKAVDHLKRPDLARHHFPSQDIWEDTPESLQYQTTVDTEQQAEDLGASAEFELPATEAARKNGNAPTDRADFLSDEAKKMAKSHFKPGVMDEMRPGLAQRFPSQDIWEDTPDSLQYSTTVQTPQMPEDLETSVSSLPPAHEEHALPKFNRALEESMRQRFPSHDIWEDSPDSLRLETTVTGPQQPEESDIISPDSATSSSVVFTKPQIPARPAKTTKLEGESTAAQPSLPPRPAQKTRQVPPADAEVPSIPPRPSANKAPVLPDRPKPQIPARPAKGAVAIPAEPSSLSKVVSNASTSSAESAVVKSPPEVKAKPTIPARPVNANFANLRAGFMNDLNSRLKIGPKEPKKEEEVLEEAKVEEKAPLVDARKGRAKGPTRRKPAAAAAPTDDSSTSTGVTSLGVSTTSVVWQIDENGDLRVSEAGDDSARISSAEAELERIASANTDSAAPASSTGAEQFTASPEINNTLSDPVGAEGDAADSSNLSASTIQRADAIQPGLEAALADSRQHGEGPAMGSTDVAASVPDFTSETPASGGQAAKDAYTAEVRTEALNSTPIGASTSEEQAAATADIEPGKADVVHQAAQTGEKDISIQSPTGEQEKIKITIGGDAQQGRDVVSRADGEEVVN